MDATADPRKTVLEKYRKGLVQVYTGDGKGKTTAAFGQALRAIGQGCRVCVIQFMKGRKYGECLAAEKYLPNLMIHLAGLDSFVMRDNPAPLDIELARQGLDIARKAIASGDYEMVILDEINVAADFRLIPLDDVVDPHRPLRPAGDHCAGRHGERNPGGPSSLQRRREGARRDRILNKAAGPRNNTGPSIWSITLQ
jgi:cob(I)alamin adenosyltransferase